MDYLAYDSTTKRIWIPAGNTGKVDVIESASGKLTAIDGFPTAERNGTRGKRTVGPSAATVGGGSVYIGNRADSQVCALDGKTFQRHGCVALPSQPDGLAYVAVNREVWVTLPRENALAFLDVGARGALVIKGKLTVPGKPEGYAVDAGRGLFYTNLEDKNQTLVIDVRTHNIVATWQSGCGQVEPQGLVLDAKRRLLFVACADKTVALAADRDGAVVSQISTGDGVDVIDYDATRGLLYAPSGKTAKLSVIKVGPQGELTLVAVAPTAAGSRAVLVDGSGNAYVADSAGGRLLLIHPPAN